MSQNQPTSAWDRFVDGQLQGLREMAANDPNAIALLDNPKFIEGFKKSLDTPQNRAALFGRNIATTDGYQKASRETRAQYQADFLGNKLAPKEKTAAEEVMLGNYGKAGEKLAKPFKQGLTQGVTGQAVQLATGKTYEVDEPNGGLEAFAQTAGTLVSDMPSFLAGGVVGKGVAKLGIAGARYIGLASKAPANIAKVTKAQKAIDAAKKAGTEVTDEMVTAASSKVKKNALDVAGQKLRIAAKRSNLNKTVIDPFQPGAQRAAQGVEAVLSRKQNATLMKNLAHEVPGQAAGFGLTEGLHSAQGDLLQVQAMQQQMAQNEAAMQQLSQQLGEAKRTYRARVTPTTSKKELDSLYAELVSPFEAQLKQGMAQQNVMRANINQMLEALPQKAIEQTQKGAAVGTISGAASGLLGGALSGAANRAGAARVAPVTNKIESALPGQAGKVFRAANEVVEEGSTAAAKAAFQGGARVMGETEAEVWGNVGMGLTNPEDIHADRAGEMTGFLTMRGGSAAMRGGLQAGRFAVTPVGTTIDLTGKFANKVQQKLQQGQTVVVPQANQQNPVAPGQPQAAQVAVPQPTGEVDPMIAMYENMNNPTGAATMPNPFMGMAPDQLATLAAQANEQDDPRATAFLQEAIAQHPGLAEQVMQTQAQNAQALNPFMSMPPDQLVALAQQVDEQTAPEHVAALQEAIAQHPGLAEQVQQAAFQPGVIPGMTVPSQQNPFMGMPAEQLAAMVQQIDANTDPRHAAALQEAIAATNGQQRPITPAPEARPFTPAPAAQVQSMVEQAPQVQATVAPQQSESDLVESLIRAGNTPNAQAPAAAPESYGLTAEEQEHVDEYTRNLITNTGGNVGAVIQHAEEQAAAEDAEGNDLDAAFWRAVAAKAQELSGLTQDQNDALLTTLDNEIPTAEIPAATQEEQAPAVAPEIVDSQETTEKTTSQEAAGATEAEVPVQPEPPQTSTPENALQTQGDDQASNDADSAEDARAKAAREAAARMKARKAKINEAPAPAAEPTPTPVTPAAPAPTRRRHSQESNLPEWLHSFTPPESGEVLVSASGRTLPPVPKLDFSNDKKARNSIKRLDEWMLEEARKEPNAAHNVLLKGINLNNMSPSDRYIMSHQLFGDMDGPTDANRKQAEAPTPSQDTEPKKLIPTITEEGDQVRVKFNKIPPKSVLADLKAAGFTWNKKDANNKFWEATKTPEAMAQVRDLRSFFLDEEAPMVKRKPAAPAPAPQGGNIIIHEPRTGHTERIPVTPPAPAKSAADQKIDAAANEVLDILKDLVGDKNILNDERGEFDPNAAKANIPVAPKLFTAMLKLGHAFIEKGVTDFSSWSEQMLDKLKAYADQIRPWLQAVFSTVSQVEKDFDAEDYRAIIEASIDVYNKGNQDAAAFKAGLIKLLGDDLADVVEEVAAPIHAGLVKMPGLKHKEVKNERAPGSPDKEGLGGGATDSGSGSAPTRDAGSRDSQDSGSRSDDGGRTPAEGDRSSRGDGDRTGGSDQGVGKNHLIREIDEIGKGGPKVKFEANLAAIKLLKQLEAEDRLPTDEEKRTLARFIGWGGLSQVLDPATPRRYGPGTWQNKGYHELHPDHGGLLTKKEWDDASGSTQNAHYTSPAIVKAIWDGVLAAGFKGGKVLEPAVGIGNFFGLKPSGVKAALSGIELDTLTARMAAKLYPEARIQNIGFEKATPASNSYDLVISNVPFAPSRPYDKEFNKDRKLVLHDFFIVKGMDKVKPGGLGVFITATGTMDKENDTARRKIMESSDLVFALRLPSTTFEENAGTSVTTDLLVFRKRMEGEPAGDNSWINSTKGNPRGFGIFTYNKYFQNNDAALLGNPDRPRTYIAEEGGDGMGLKDSGVNVPAAIRGAFLGVKDAFKTPTQETSTPNKADMFPAPGHVAQGGYGVKDGKVYRRQGNEMIEVQRLGDEKTARIVGMLGVRDAIRALLKAEYEGKDEAETSKLRAELNKVYDAFVNTEITVNRPEKPGSKKKVKVKEKMGFIFSLPNLKAMFGDPDMELLKSLEKWDYETQTATKADIFTKATVNPSKDITKADNAVDAMAVVLNETGRLDFKRMQELTGMTFEQIREDLRGAIFEQPDGTFVSRDEYLSGNVRKKLRDAQAAAEEDPKFKENVEALEANQPEDLTWGQLMVRLGTAWIPESDIQDFIRSVVEGKARVRHNTAAGSWEVLEGGDSNHPNQKRYGVDAPRSTGGRVRAKTFADLLQDTLNLKATEVKVDVPDGEGGYKSVVSKELTEAARLKQQEIRNLFDAWIGSDEDRVKRLVDYYNTEINNIVNRKFDGSHLTFPGMSPVFAPGGAKELRPYQKNAIWRIIQTRTTLLNHAVGSGKTFEMIGAGMEMKRMGLVKKPMYVVLNSMIEQFPADILTLYPGAKILVLSKSEMEPKKRRALLARVATGDWDAVVVTHEQFEAIETKIESQQVILDEELEALRETLNAMRADGASERTVKQIQKQLDDKEAALQAKMDKAMEKRKDKILTFEELGVDQLFVDEAHYHKNLPLSTKLSGLKNVGGGADSARAVDMQIKTRHLLDKQGGKGVVFATGTPITNAISEVYRFQKFLQPKLLKERGLYHFDSWAGTFTQARTENEINELGQFTPVTRLVAWMNRPELVDMVSEFIDTQTSQMLADGGYLPRPDIMGGSTQGIAAKLGEAQSRIMQQLIQVKASIQGKPNKKGQPNHASISSVARRLSLDPRIIDENASDEPGSKVNLMIEKALDIYMNGEELTDRNGHTGKTAQAIFINVQAPTAEDVKKQRIRFGWAAEPKKEEPKPVVDGEDDVSDKPAVEEGEDAVKADAEAIAAAAADAAKAGVTARAMGYGPSRFNIYSDIVKKLVSAGVKESEIAFIHAAQTPAEKRELMEKVRRGDIRIILGGTKNMGVGVNIQDRLIAVHHADTPWTPDGLEQANGRAHRFGNLNKEIQIYSYGTERTMDATMYEVLEKKQRAINEMWNGDRANRHSAADLEDEGDNLSLSEMKALFSGDPLIREFMKIDSELPKIEMEHKIFSDEHKKIAAKVAELPAEISTFDRRIDALEDDIKRMEDTDAAAEERARVAHQEVMNAWEKAVKDWEDGGKEGDKPARPATQKKSMDITLFGEIFDNRPDADAKLNQYVTENWRKLKAEADKNQEVVEEEIGSYAGFKLSIRAQHGYDTLIRFRGPKNTVHDRVLVEEKTTFEEVVQDDGTKQMKATTKVDVKDLGSIIRWMSDSIERDLGYLRSKKGMAEVELKNSEFDLTKKFPRQEELTTKRKRLAELKKEFERREQIEIARKDTRITSEGDRIRIGVVGSDGASNEGDIYAIDHNNGKLLVDEEGTPYADNSFKTDEYLRMGALKIRAILDMTPQWDAALKDIKMSLADLFFDEVQGVGLLKGVAAVAGIGLYAHLASGGASVTAATIAVYVGAKALPALKAKLAKRYGGIVASVESRPALDVEPEKTSVNQRPAAITAAIARGLVGPGKVNLDLGGGRYEQGNNMVKAAGGENILIDPYSRSYEYNADSLRKLMKQKDGVDTATLSAVLNVIPDAGIQEAVVKQAHDALKDGGTLVVNIYEGNRTGTGAVTSKNTWQENKKAADYVPLIEKVFGKGNVKRSGQIIEAIKKVITGPKGILADEEGAFDSKVLKDNAKKAADWTKAKADHAVKRIKSISKLTQEVKALGFDTIEDAREALRREAENPGSEPRVLAMSTELYNDLMSDQDSWFSPNQKVEAFMNAGKGAKLLSRDKQKQSFAERVKDFFKVHWILDEPYAGVDGFFRDGKEALRQGRHAFDHGLNMAIEDFQKVIGKLTRKDAALLNRYVLFRDLQEDVDRDLETFVGQLTPDEITDELQRLTVILDKNPRVKDALGRHDDLFAKIRDILIDRGKLNAEEAREFYQPHKILNHLNKAGLFSLPKPLMKAARPYLRSRKGSEHYYVTDYLERNVHHVASVYRDNMIDDTLEKTAAAYDIRQKNPHGHTLPKNKNGTVSVRKLQANPPDGYVAYQANPKAGFKSKVYIIPEELAAILGGYKEEFRILDNPFKSAVQFWKRLILTSHPIRYNLRNFIGDTEKTFVEFGAEPFKFVKQAFDDLEMVAQGRRGKVDINSPEYLAALERVRDAERRGVINSGQVHREIGYVRDLSEFKQLNDTVSDHAANILSKWDNSKKAQSIRKVAPEGWEIVKLVSRRYVNGFDKLSTTRENLMRLAIYYANVKRAEDGKDLLNNPGIKIKGMSDKRDMAAKISREGLGDYGNLTIHEQKWLRDGLAPFYSWMKVNFASHVRLIESIVHKEFTIPKGTGGKLGRRAATIPLKAMRVIKRLAVLFMIPWVFNNTMFAHQEAQLPEHIRSEWHLNTGIQWDNGEWFTITTPSALNDFLQMTGFAANMGESLDRLVRGEYGLDGFLKERVGYTITKPAMKILQSGGLIGGVVGVGAFNTQTFPEITPVKPENKGREIVKATGLGNIPFAGTIIGAIPVVGQQIAPPNPSNLTLGVTKNTMPSFRFEDLNFEIAGKLNEFNRVMGKADGMDMGEYMTNKKPEERQKEAKRLRAHAEGVRKDIMDLWERQSNVPANAKDTDLNKGMMVSIAKALGTANAIIGEAEGEPYKLYEDGLIKVIDKMQRIGDGQTLIKAKKAYQRQFRSVSKAKIRDHARLGYEESSTMGESSGKRGLMGGLQ